MNCKTITSPGFCSYIYIQLNWTFLCCNISIRMFYQSYKIFTNACHCRFSVSVSTKLNQYWHKEWQMSARACTMVRCILCIVIGNCVSQWMSYWSMFEVPHYYERFSYCYCLVFTNVCLYLLVCIQYVFKAISLAVILLQAYACHEPSFKVMRSKYANRSWFIRIVANTMILFIFFLHLILCWVQPSPVHFMFCCVSIFMHTISKGEHEHFIYRTITKQRRRKKKTGQ